MKTIAVIGYGYVGKAIVNFFKDHYNVVARDIDREFRFENGKLVAEEPAAANNWNAVNQADLAVICVPTPMMPDGGVDLRAIEDVFQKVTTPLILIKSTIPPGTTKSLAKKTGKEIVFSPEFLGEGKYVVQWWKDRGYPHPTDMKYHDFQIFGGERSSAVKALQFFKTILGPEVKYIFTDSTTAELCKYMENSWAATKVTFSNEFFEIAKSLGVDYDELRELWLLDGRVERMHTAVFFDKRGFSGKCLPKDVNGIITVSEKAGYEPQLLKEVIRSNERFQKLN